MLPVVEPDGESTARRIVLVLGGADSASACCRSSGRWPAISMSWARSWRACCSSTASSRIVHDRTPCPRPRRAAGVGDLPADALWSPGPRSHASVVAAAGVRSRAVPQKPLPVYGPGPAISTDLADGSAFHSAYARRQRLGSRLLLHQLHRALPAHEFAIPPDRTSIRWPAIDLKLVSITVDPERDTPPALADYAASSTLSRAAGSS